MFVVVGSIMSKPIALRARSGERVTRPAVVQSRTVRLPIIVAACCVVGLAFTPRALADETLIKKKSGHYTSLRGKAVALVIPDQVLLEPAAAPDCAFRGTMSNPAEQIRAKLEYEAQCYRQAEAIVRERLGQLQDAAEKMIRAIRHRNLVISSR
jgi:hypothetical protein